MGKEHSVKSPCIAMFLIAGILALSVTLYLYFHHHPYQLKVMKIVANRNGPVNYVDINHDGFSEEYKILNDMKRKAYYIRVLNYDRAIFDQLNTKEPINPLWVFFGDYTDDGFDECFIFTTKEDSLFLYIYDILNKKELLSRHYLMHIRRNHPYLKISGAQLVDLNGTRHKQFLFLIHGGRAPKPRGLYVFDIDSLKIVKRFESLSAMSHLLLTDLNGDGKKEIIILGNATGNIPRNQPFSDWNNHIFFLDQNLKNIFPPLTFGEFPSNVIGKAIRINDKPYLLVGHYRYSPEHCQKPIGLLLINNRGLFEKKRYYSAPNSRGLNIFFDSDDKPDQIFVSLYSNKLLVADHNLNIITKKRLPVTSFRLRGYADVNNDGQRELLGISVQSLFILSPTLKTLAVFSVGGDDEISSITLRKNGLERPMDIGINTVNKFYHLKLKKDPIFSWLIAIFFALFIGFILLFLLLRFAILQILIFKGFLNYNLRHSQNALLLVNPKGIITFFNVRLQTLLEIEETDIKKADIRKVFSSFPFVLEAFNQAQKTRETVRTDFSCAIGTRIIKGEISVVPFKTKFNFIYAYLIEIREFTASLISDRQKTWSSTIRKIAHSIKTPLSTVMLNIERIQQKISDRDSEIFKATENDFSMTINEIKRIHEMTRNFLKFTKLELSNVREVALEEILRETLRHFEAYTNNGVTIRLNLHPEPYQLLGDAKMLEMAFQIFIENAIDAMKGKGTILITSSLAQNLFEDKDYLEIEIADNGPGIPRDLRDQIFEPFMTTKKDGSGMGLAIARKIIIDHGGQLELVTKENFGTVFRIVLPATKGKS